MTMAIALDVGGVLYFDEPFELAWVQEVYDGARAECTAFTVEQLYEDLLRYHGGTDEGGIFRTPVADRAWIRVREQWPELVQPIPGSVEAVAASLPIGVVAN